ncbi:hypothetical protein FRB99_005696 [Tulasnella sp. 403]|nr:hypothetical protein FRB99_005696 [Tulasnella sp. 403]
MSDTGRQSFTDKAGAALKPDSQKSTTEYVGDKFKGNADSAAGTVQGSKSTTQKAGDTATGDDRSVLDKARDALGMGERP